MFIKNKISLRNKTLYVSVLLAVFLSASGSGGSLSLVAAQETTVQMPGTTSASGYILSDGQFVYGPNIGDFNIRTYLEYSAPHLSMYADDLYGRSEYFSINPKIYLTLLEVHSRLISVPDAVIMENPFGLKDGDFISQIEVLSNKMSEAYYLHLYSYSPLPVSQRSLPPFVTPGGVTINVAAETNAGTYAIIAGLAAVDEQNIALILDKSQTNGFYQTYLRLFGNDDPLDETNHLYIPGGVGALAVPPESLLQLPYLRGLSWRFGGVHNTGGASVFTDASSLDFYPSSSTWNMDTSNMWVVAAASGIPTRYSDCGFKVSHSGAVNIGWETTYYHLEGAKYLSGFINQNDKIGVIANTLAEATCTGGAASGPHVHFSLKYNGAYVPMNGTPLAGWYVHSGRYSYDVDPNYMWFERAGVKKYAYADVVLSEAPPAAPTVTSIVRANLNPTIATSVVFTVTFSESVIGVDMVGPVFDDFSLTTTGGISGESVSGLGGSGSIYTVTVNTGSGTGTVRLDVVDNDTIVDLTSNPLGGPNAGNGNFISEQTYTVVSFVYNLFLPLILR